MCSCNKTERASLFEPCIFYRDVINSENMADDEDGELYKDYEHACAFAFATSTDASSSTDIPMVTATLSQQHNDTDNDNDDERGYGGYKSPVLQQFPFSCTTRTLPESLIRTPPYKGAMFVFFNPKDRTFFLGHEPEQQQWCSFGGPIRADGDQSIMLNGPILDPFVTAARELYHQTNGQMSVPPYSYDFSFFDSKTVTYVFVKLVLSQYVFDKLTNMRPTDSKSKFAWFQAHEFEHVHLPRTLLAQLQQTRALFDVMQKFHHDHSDENRHDCKPKPCPKRRREEERDRTRNSYKLRSISIRRR